MPDNYVDQIQIDNGSVVKIKDTLSGYTTNTGDVVGPSSATNGTVVLFDGTTGKLIKNSSYTINKSVPSDAKFTDTTYTGTGLISINSSNVISTTAQANVIETVKVNGTALTPSSKAVDISVPTITDTYSSTSTNGMSGKAVASALGTLDVTGASSISASKTISAWSETDGKVSITTQDISITKSQVSDFPTLGTASAKDVPSSGNASSTQVVMGNDTRLTNSRTPTSHTHGNIQNNGTLQTTDITIANGDKLIVTDASSSTANQVARTSVTFDGSTTTQCLTKKGTWANFTNNAGTITGITMNGSSKGTSGVVDLGTVITDKSDKMDKQDPVGNGTFTMNGSIVSPSSGSVCLGSNTNYIDGSTNSTIAGGSGNSIYNSGRSFIAGGGDNEISMGAVDVFMTGNSNSMIATSQSSVHGEGSHSATLGIGNRQCWDNSLIWGSYNSMSEPVAGGDLDSLSILEIVGNGTSTSARSNARVLTRTGNEYLAGNLYSAGSLNGTDVNASGNGQFKNVKANSKSLTPYTTAGVTNVASVTSGVSTSDFQCKVIGDLCMLSFGMSWTESVHSSIITGLTLKSGFRPYSQAICIALSDNGNGGSFGFGRLLINTSGQVRFTPVTQTAFANCHRCFVNITFVLATEYTVS